MKTLLAPEEAIERAFGTGKGVIEYKLVNAGLTNHTFFLQNDGRPLVLRVDTEGAALLGLDRTVELGVLRRASRTKIAPEVVFADPAAGLLVCEYLQGRALEASDLTASGTLETLAGVLREVHQLPACGTSFAASDAAARYVGIVRSDPDLHAFALYCATSIAAIPAPSHLRCCHHDIVARNVILDPATSGRLRLIDWEYTCDNDPLFDLASLIGYHDIAAAPADILLCAYTGGNNAEARDHLQLQLRLFDLLQWLWLAAQQVLMPRSTQLDRLRELRQRIA
ncbi:MAG TPA: choline/ethanolamine kinase family protein [Woeseiaceae bacterium]